MLPLTRSRNRARFFGIPFSPSVLFEGGTVAGAWYDPSDLSTMFDTSAGTTPVAMPGQGAAVPVGLMLDKSQNGVGTNGAKRVNLLRWSEVFDATASGSAWANTGVTVTDGVLAPNGTNTADTITGTTGTYPNVRQAITLPAAGTYKASCYFQKTSGATRFPSVEINFAPGNALVILNTDTGVATNAQGTPTNISVSDAGGYWLVSFDVAINITSATFFIYPASSSNGTSIAPNLTGSCVAWGADLRLASEANTAPTYQRIDANWYSTLAGNHAISFNNTTARPELRARVNLLERSEEFNNAYWTKSGILAFGSGSVVDATTAPDGTVTADLITETATTAVHIIARTGLSLTGSFVYSVSGKANGRFITLSAFAGNGNFAAVTFDLVNGTVTEQSSNGSQAITSAPGPVVQSNGFFRCSVTANFVGVSEIYVCLSDVGNPVALGGQAAIDGRRRYAGNGTSGAYIWGADLRPANIGTTIPAYQRIADANTYDTNGFPLYLRFDGIDDSMYTPASIPFATVTSDGQARRNLLSVPTLFNDAAWTKSNVSEVAGKLAPDGTNTAFEITATAANGILRQQLTLTGADYTFSIWLRRVSGTGSIGISAHTGGTIVNVTLTSSWQRFDVTQTLTAGVRLPGVRISTSGDVIEVWSAQLELGSTATAFQNIGTDKVAVFAGVRKLSDAAQGVVAELSATIASNNGTFLLAAPDGATQTYGWDSKGTTQVDAVASSLAAPRTNVLVGTADIAGDSCIIRVNGAVADTEAGDQGTGNYGTYPLYIGSRNNASNWLNGQLYSLIIAGSAVSAGNISATEQWVAGKTGIQI